MIIYHGGYCAIENPEIRVSRNKKDFGNGFYCTELQSQAEKWSKRYNTPTVSQYEYTPSAALDLLKFDTMTDEWLDFIVGCRTGKPHNHAIVEGAMANDQVKLRSPSAPSLHPSPTNRSTDTAKPCTLLQEF